MPKYEVVRLSIDRLIEEAMAISPLDRLSRHTVRALFTNAGVAALYFISKEDEGLQAAAMQVSALAHSCLRDDGVVDRATIKSIYEVIDRIFAREYEAVVDLVIKRREQDNTNIVES